MKGKVGVRSWDLNSSRTLRFFSPLNNEVINAYGVFYAQLSGHAFYCTRCFLNSNPEIDPIIWPLSMNAQLYLDSFFNLAHISLRKNTGTGKKP